LTVYPNPSYGNQINIRLPEGMVGASSMVSVFNLLGQQAGFSVLRFNGDGMTIALQPGTPPGIYTVAITDGIRTYSSRLTVAE
jgi:Secretion system C-terminal sorting domain